MLGLLSVFHALPALSNRGFLITNIYLLMPKIPGLTDPVIKEEIDQVRRVRTQTVTESAKLKGGIKYILPCWCKSAVVFSQRKNLTIEHSKDPSRWHAPQLTLTASFGATRVEPQKVLGIEISQASLSGIPSKEELKPAKKEEKKAA